jgi:xanthine dehydrogenase molybdenum-binding subunit
MRVEFGLNGRPCTIEPEAGESLLEALRERCRVKSLKDGCQPQGQCGCCLALIDGHPLVTCAVDAGRVAGKQVLTLEGLSAEERAGAARAFVAAGGLQCGFCIPGIALRAKHLLDHKPNPTRAEIALAIDGHLCRCTGYVKILDAVELWARARRG